MKPGYIILAETPIIALIQSMDGDAEEIARGVANLRLEFPSTDFQFLPQSYTADRKLAGIMALRVDRLGNMEVSNAKKITGE